eukprot:m51a1_g5154 hypothetical protein (330) ;mRNA; r:71089-77437
MKWALLILLCSEAAVASAAGLSPAMLGIIEADSHKGVARIFEDGSYYFVSERHGVQYRPETMAVGDTLVYWSGDGGVEGDETSFAPGDDFEQADEEPQTQAQGRGLCLPLCHADIGRHRSKTDLPLPKRGESERDCGFAMGPVVVTADYAPQGVYGHLFVRKGDTGKALAEKCGLCLCRFGAASGFVPCDYLAAKSEEKQRLVASGKPAVVLEDCPATRQGRLTVYKGDIVLVLEAGVWTSSVQVDGQSGLVPTSYLMALYDRSCTAGNDIAVPRTMIALADCMQQGRGRLHACKGDIVSVMSIESGWCIGQIGDECGYILLQVLEDYF